MRGSSGSRAASATAVVAALVAVLAVMAFPGVGVGETNTIEGGTPSNVLMNTESEICASVDINGAVVMSTDDVNVEQGDTLLAYFTSEFSGIDTRTELLLSFEVLDDEDNIDASTPFEWGFVGNATRIHSTATVMWPFGGLDEDIYTVRMGARVDPLPGPLGGSHPSATLENCALTVFVIPA
jgi:hypothetical protein